MGMQSPRREKTGSGKLCRKHEASEWDRVIPAYTTYRGDFAGM